MACVCLLFDSIMNSNWPSVMSATLPFDEARVKPNWIEIQRVATNGRLAEHARWHRVSAGIFGDHSVGHSGSNEVAVIDRGRLGQVSRAPSAQRTKQQRHGNTEEAEPQKYDSRALITPADGKMIRLVTTKWTAADHRSAATRVRNVNDAMHCERQS